MFLQDLLYESLRVKIRRSAQKPNASNRKCLLQGCISVVSLFLTIVSFGKLAESRYIVCGKSSWGYLNPLTKNEYVTALVPTDT